MLSKFNCNTLGWKTVPYFICLHKLISSIFLSDWIFMHGCEAGNFNEYSQVIQ